MKKNIFESIKKYVSFVFVLAFFVAIVGFVSFQTVKADDTDTGTDITVPTDPVILPSVEDQAPSTDPVVPLVEDPAPTIDDGSVQTDTDIDIDSVPQTDVVPSEDSAPAPSVPVMAPELSSDKGDYHPGETATIFGKYFGALGDFILKIFGSDDNDNNYTESIQTVTADANGEFTSSYNLDDLYRPFYQMTASALDGTILAEGMFRDSAIGTYDQCSNDLGSGYGSGDTGCRWTNGNLQANNSTYIEGDSTVQRLWIEGYAPGSTHTVTFQYGTTKQGKRAYDFLTSWDASENWVTVADRCQDIAGCTTASETTLPIPSDTNGSGQFETGTRNFTLRGGTLNSATSPAIVSGTYTGDSETAITVTFTVGPSNGAMCKTKSNVTSCGIAIWFGAHIAKTSQWNPFDGTTGAGSISGSPYHVALAEEDGASVGQRDNQMQANAIIPASTITIHKVTSPDAADPTVFNFTTSGTGYGNFTLTGGNQNQQIVTGTGNFSVTETVPAAWSNTGLTCTSSGTGSSATPNLVNHSVAITIGAAGGATIDCIYTNTLQQAHLTLVKTVTNDNGGTAATTAWTLSASGPTPISGATGSGTVTNASVNAGQYSLSESGGPSGYTAGTWSCVGGTQNGSNVTLTAGQSATCTINNNDNAAHLIVIKNVINDNGGTKVAGDFSGTISGVTAVGGNTWTGTISPGLDKTLATVGAYNVTENADAGYNTTYSTDCVGTIALGETKTCTVTNNDKPAHLIVIKHVINDNGGTKTASDFTMTIGGVTAVGGNSFAGAENPGIDKTLSTVGAYTVTEGAVSGYTQTSASTDCSGTIALGETKTCTITNDDISPKLTVTKIVINDNGGTKVVSDFPLFVGNTGVTSGVQNNFNAGAYVVSETTDAGYTSTISGDCDAQGNVSLALADVKACTITNNDIAPTLKIVKTVINDNGGTKVASDFQGKIDGNNTAWNVAQTVSAGSHTASETNLPGYTAGVWGGDCAADGSVTLGLAENKTCTITNDDQQAYIIVDKTVINDNGGTAAPNDFLLTVDGNAVSDEVAYPVNPGVHTAGETLLSGYQAGAWGGDCNQNASVTVALGETKTCTITNNDIQPTLKLIKHVVNDNGGTKVVSDFPLFVDATPVVSGVVNGFNAGSYTASETNQTGYQASSWSGDCAADGSVTLGIGENKVCEITNDDISPKLTVTKIVINHGGNKQVSDFPLFVGNTGVTSGVQNNFNAGAYVVSETGDSNYTATISGDCDTQGNVTLALADVKACTITNEEKPAKVIVHKIVINHGLTNDATHFAPYKVGTTTVTLDTETTMNSGSYVVSEATDTNYNATFTAGDCDANGNITLTPGTTKSCTITNEEKPSTLKLVKTVINDNGGTKVVSDFVLKIDSTPVTSGVANSVNSGSYTASEINLPGYTAGAWGGDCAADGSVTVPSGTNKVCTITNNDIAPTLKIVKTVINDNGGTKVASDFQGKIDGNNTAWNVAQTVSAGSHTASETNLPGYTAGVWGGDCAADGSVTLGLAENKTCTITNDDQVAHLIVIKHVINHGGSAVAGNFTMNVTGTNVSNPSFAGAENPGTNVTLNAGSYSADESLNANYTKTLGANCSGTIANGETKTCTITNEEKTAKITIIKDAQPNDCQDFAFTATGQSGFSLDDDNNDASCTDTNQPVSKSFTNVNTGNMTITETQPNSFWKLSGATCVNTVGGGTYASSLAGTSLTVNLTPGADVTCTFVNYKASPTRTQGFWQTHTTYTTSVFNAAPLSGSMFIGNGTTHKGPVDTIGKVFGAFYSNIAKKTVGGNRTSIDKARMQLLQQLVAAKLNCANFGCSASVQTMITAADAAYAGTSEAAILSFVGQVDAYNNSGDTLTIGNAGSATPQTSKTLANMAFWDLP